MNPQITLQPVKNGWIIHFSEPKKDGPAERTTYVARSDAEAMRITKSKMKVLLGGEGVARD